jgi:hypothetical protein
MPQRAARLRPYFFEVFTIANFVIIAAWMWSFSKTPLTSIPGVFSGYLPGFAGLTIVGLLVRGIVAWRQGRGAAFLRVIRSAGWLSDTVRIGLFSAFSVHTYCWIKLAVPLLHKRFFDQQLWDLDAKLLAGYQPNVFFLTLFSHPNALRAVDWTYANVFVGSLWLASIYFASATSRRLRVAFMDSHTAMWILGAWLYMLIPSLGPAYRFPQIWLPLAASLPHTQYLQRMLMTNYQLVLQGKQVPVNVLFGVAAFPSLHVAFETLVFLWMRRLWARWGEALFGLIALVIFVGSVVTGWHYLIDSLAGIVLALVCYACASRAHRMRRWLAIRSPH